MILCFHNTSVSILRHHDTMLLQYVFTIPLYHYTSENKPYHYTLVTIQHTISYHNMKLSENFCYDTLVTIRYPDMTLSQYFSHDTLVTILLKR